MSLNEWQAATNGCLIATVSQVKLQPAAHRIIGHL